MMGVMNQQHGGMVNSSNMGNAGMYLRGGMNKNNNDSNLWDNLGMLVHQSGMMNSEMDSNGTIHGCRMEVIDNSII